VIIPIDERVRTVFNLNQMNTANFLNYIYPQCFALHQPIQNTVDSDSNIDGNSNSNSNRKNAFSLGIIPRFRRIPLSASQIDSHGIYLFDDTLNTYFYVGKNCSPTLLSQIFSNGNGSESNENENENKNKEETIKFSDIGPTTQILFNYASKTGSEIGNLFEKILRRNRHQFGKIYIFKETQPQRQYFFARLIADKHQFYDSYLGFVSHLHREINKES